MNGLRVRCVHLHEQWLYTLEQEMEMNAQEKEFDRLSDDELHAVSGGEEVAHLPQSIHIDYQRLKIDQNPTRIC